MSLFDVIVDTQKQQKMSQKIYGVVIGIVSNNKDPEKLGRVKVKFPWLSDNDESYWARIATPMAGPKRGIYFIPEIDDEVLVVFEHGDLRFPYILGALWNVKDIPPPEAKQDGKNNIRLIKSRSGHIISFDDTNGQENIEILDKTKSNSIKVDTKSNTITIKTDKDIKLSAPRGVIQLDAHKIKINSTDTTDITAVADMNIKATGKDANTIIKSGTGKAKICLN
ncbi:phage baseplate assembly protein V [Mastigocoleus sp. MO_188.B34]|uniref:phage baseplate assembly protein V n=1 Tax=Mastigocoleus sp. MO_188.B34 TaxID=3036635 RepID=UPI00260A2BF3|nr:phage baseplate assembly protein V [Mastigocoleus sp. MO_188.B34]MDJ0693225.1 phage baseplate assembly protein V [Mastigocoleus sp. MO_188.B34]